MNDFLIACGLATLIVAGFTLSIGMFMLFAAVITSQFGRWWEKAIYGTVSFILFWGGCALGVWALVECFWFLVEMP